MAGHTLAGPLQKGFLPHQVILEAFWEKPKKMASHKVTQKALSLFMKTFFRDR